MNLRGPRPADPREAPRLRDRRSQLKRARTVVAGTPGLAETLVGDWRKAAAFYARFEITETLLRYGVPVGDGICRCPAEAIRRPLTEHARIVLPPPAVA